MLFTRSFASCEVLLEDARSQGDAQGWELLQVSPRAPRHALRPAFSLPESNASSEFLSIHS